ncbi:MAG: hypothetical protein PHT07_18905 [Paludibacter sp.]|nr:hypothetical protein [Paludibacter sp.]
MKTTTTMKSLSGVIALMFICSSLNAQNPIRKEKNSVYSIINGIFQNSKVSAHRHLGMPQSATISPYFKVKQSEQVKYQLDSLIFTPVGTVGDMTKTKIECKYDRFGRMIQFISKSLNISTNNYELNYKYVYIYMGLII